VPWTTLKTSSSDHELGCLPTFTCIPRGCHDVGTDVMWLPWVCIGQLTSWMRELRLRYCSCNHGGMPLCCLGCCSSYRLSSFKPTPIKSCINDIYELADPRKHIYPSTHIWPSSPHKVPWLAQKTRLRKKCVFVMTTTAHMTNNTCVPPRADNK